MHLQLTRPVIVALCVALGAAGVVASGQPEAGVPQLAPDARLRLQNFDLRGENIALKMAALQAEFTALQAEATAYAETLRRDGYVLQRGADGAYAYVPAPARPPQEPKP